MNDLKERRHPLFLTKLKDIKVPLLARLANQFLSVGGSCYYMNEDTIKTRLYIYNYFALLNGGPFHTVWWLTVYSQDGKRKLEKKGNFAESQTITVEIEPFAETLGALGLCMLHLYPAESAYTIRNSYMTHFFVEYYTPKAAAVIHSLGHVVPKFHKANDYITSSIREDEEALLLVSNSCYRSFRYPKQLFERGVRIELRNTQGQTRHVDLDPILPLACRKINLRKIWPDLNSFVMGKPIVLRVCGPNVLYSPLVIQIGSNGSIALDHFQGLDWDEYDSSFVC